MDGRPPGPIDPVPGDPRETRASYDRLSAGYALAVEDLEFPPTAMAIRGLDLEPGTRAVDLGCGAGRAVVEMARRVGRDGRVVGVDFAPGMARQARRAIRRVDVGDRAAVVGGDVTDLPIRTDAMDAATSSFVLDLLPPAGIDAALEEARRVLMPEGRLATVSLAPSEAITTRGYMLLRRLFPTMLDCRPIPIEAFLEDAGFAVDWAHRYSLHGLPVSVVLSRVE